MFHRYFTPAAYHVNMKKLIDPDVVYFTVLIIVFVAIFRM